MIDIIVDIETLGTKPGCPIIEIGACAIDADTGKIVGNFSRRIAVDFAVGNVVDVAIGEAVIPGIDKATAIWWSSDPGRLDVLKQILFVIADIDSALMGFSEFFRTFVQRPDEGRIWANGPSFDIAILDRSYDDNRIHRPWICWQERCVRTALELCGYEKGSVEWSGGPRHRALNDARHEAKKLWHCGALGTTSEIAKRLRQRGSMEVPDASHG